MRQFFASDSPILFHFAKNGTIWGNLTPKMPQYHSRGYCERSLPRVTRGPGPPMTIRPADILKLDELWPLRAPKIPPQYRGFSGAETVELRSILGGPRFFIDILNPGSARHPSMPGDARRNPRKRHPLGAGEHAAELG